jgi:hypothetical protein
MALPGPISKVGPPGLSSISVHLGPMLEVVEMGFYRSYIYGRGDIYMLGVV